MKATKAKHPKTTHSAVRPVKLSGADPMSGGMDADDTVEGLDAEEYAKKVFTTLHTKLFKDELAAGRALFCPGCLCDWDALARLSDIARVFVFSADRVNKLPTGALSLSNCPKKLGRLFTTGATGELDTHTCVGHPAPIFGGLAGHYAFFDRNIELNGDVMLRRRLMAVIVDAAPVAAYERLFVQAGAAPSCVSLLHAGWKGPMKEMLLRAGPAAPKSLIAEWPGGYGPWNWRWRHLRSWGKAAVFRRRTDPAHPAIQLRQSPEMAFENTPLSPQHIGGADAVVVTLEQYLGNWWGDERLRIFIDSTDEGAVAEIRAYDRRVEALSLRGHPLVEAADALAHACGSTIRHVHANYLGLEDEAEAIWRGWKNAYGYIRLVLHGTPAEWASLDQPCPDLE